MSWVRVVLNPALHVNLSCICLLSCISVAAYDDNIVFACKPSSSEAREHRASRGAQVRSSDAPSPAAGGVRGVSPRQPPRLPASAEEHLLGAGHSASEPGLTDAIVRATEPVWDAKTGDGEAWA